MTIVYGIAGGGGVALDGGLMAVRAAREPIRKFLRLDCPMLRYGELRAMTQDKLLLTAMIAFTSVVSGVLAYMALTF